MSRACATLILACAPYCAGTSNLLAQSTVPLFDRTLSGWTISGTEPQTFVLRDDTLTVDGPAGWLRSERQYGDFLLKMEVRFLTADADSGIFLRSEGTSTFMRGWPQNSYQIQVRVPSTPSPLPPLGGLFRHGMAAGDTMFDAELVRRTFRGLGEWHDLEIEVAGEQLVVRIDGDEVTRAMNIQNSPGHIGIQAEAGVVEYRGVHIREHR